MPHSFRGLTSLRTIILEATSGFKRFSSIVSSVGGAKSASWRAYLIARPLAYCQPKYTLQATSPETHCPTILLEKYYSNVQ